MTGRNISILGRQVYLSRTRQSNSFIYILTRTGKPPCWHSMDTMAGRNVIIKKLDMGFIKPYWPQISLFVVIILYIASALTLQGPLQARP